ncbi:hypothetical protein [Haloarcula nitratireducens]|uniref:DUF3806 domain-containing protein n=1 Tax=Haloarcula nitratireducens TaxID=2487749 RepID=A0AAW4PE11_9EURY|nr:hypothetical protein [Halomicroarcula nitratireducens]MBX0295885.1 hypothetical protein [Halomicroarcula nitratireducens]
MGLFDKVRRAVGGSEDESADDESSDAADSEPDGRATAESTAESEPDDRAAEGPDDSDLIGEAEEPAADASETEGGDASEPRAFADAADERSDADADAGSEPDAGDADGPTADPSSVGPPAASDSPTTDPPPVDSTADSSSATGDDLGAEYAETATDFAEFWGERDLDFTPDSLSRLDDLVESEWDGDRFADATFGSEATFDDRAFTSVTRELGSYFGEVLVRDLAGEWTDETDHEAVVVVSGWDGRLAVPVFRIAADSLRETAAFARSYEALLADIDAETSGE